MFILKNKQLRKLEHEINSLAALAIPYFNSIFMPEIYKEEHLQLNGT
jgi:hypothetical protein